MRTAKTMQTCVLSRSRSPRQSTLHVKNAFLRFSRLESATARSIKDTYTEGSRLVESLVGVSRAAIVSRSFHFSKRLRPRIRPADGLSRRDDFAAAAARNACNRIVFVTRSGALCFSVTRAFLFAL